MPREHALITLTNSGLYCPRGDFYIDPWRPVDRAVITHAHADHACPGSKRYLTSATGANVLRERVQKDAVIDGREYGEEIHLGEVTISLHPAGHLLGSAQVRIDHRGEVWVITGDYKVHDDPTCETFEPVQCETLITESTFGLPIYRWPDERKVFEEIHEWWRGNQESNRTSVIYAYALGKAQRVIAGLDPGIGPILTHGAVNRFVEVYRTAGVELPPTEHVNAENAKASRGQALVVAPPSAAGTPWLRKFGTISDAFVSGWMQLRGTRRRRNVDRGFVLSDHADWPGLLRTIEATGATHIGVTHGYTDVLNRWLNERGYETSIWPTRFRGEEDDTSGDESESTDTLNAKSEAESA
ncbi:MAG: ligase-associated DNA damage response exonuclease [Phycisphaerales bacterium]|nr:MAG: ligase-associated DNA damage response exonuclease [Phycisphaerales bacterium]